MNIKACCADWIKQKERVREELIKFANTTARQLLINEMIYCGECGHILPPEKPKEWCECKDKPVRLISHCRNCGKEIENPPTIKEMLEEKSSEKVLPKEENEMLWCRHNQNIARQYQRCLICNPLKPPKQKGY